MGLLGAVGAKWIGNWRTPTRVRIAEEGKRITQRRRVPADRVAVKRRTAEKRCGSRVTPRPFLVIAAVELEE